MMIDRESVSGGRLLLLIEYLHEVCGRLFIQPGGHSGGMETVTAELAAQPDKRLDVSGCGGTGLEPDAESMRLVGDRSVKVFQRLAQAA